MPQRFYLNLHIRRQINEFEKKEDILHEEALRAIAKYLLTQEEAYIIIYRKISEEYKKFVDDINEEIKQLWALGGGKTREEFKPKRDLPLNIFSDSKEIKDDTQQNYFRVKKIEDRENGNDADIGLPTGLSERVVMQLCRDILDQNRTLYTDNFYTSVSLAQMQLRRKTHLVGTLRKNRQNTPKVVVKKVLKKGEMICRVAKKIYVAKWMDKRDVLFLSTKHKPNFCSVKVNRYADKTILKPTAIVDYNSAKTYIDVSDQLKTYGCPLRRGIKWYRKVLIEIICNMCIVNAYILYMLSTGKRSQITEFREQVAATLVESSQKNRLDTTPNDADPIVLRHKIVETAVGDRGRRVTCYEKTAREKTRQIAMKLSFIRLRCLGCAQKFMCLTCYNRLHTVKLRQ